MAGILDLILAAESSGNPYASNPNSSALGLGQFIAQTWLDTLAKHRPDLVAGKSPEELLALRTDPALARQMTAALAADNAELLGKAGISPSAGALYLAHFAGPQGAINLMKANPSTPAAQILGAAAAKANPFLANMSAGDVLAWASRKMGGSPLQAAASPVQAAQAPSAPSASPGSDVETTMASMPMSAPNFFSMLPASASTADDLPMTNYLPQRRKIDLVKALGNLNALARHRWS
jgi:hypothetical protein